METDNQVNLPDIIRNRKLLPIEIKKSIMNRVFFNCILFIIMILITLMIHIAFNKLSIRGFDAYIDIIQMVCAMIAVGILETAYRKNSGTIGIYGIEFLIFSIAVLFVPYMYIFKEEITFLKNTLLGFIIYYIAKSLGIFFYIRHNYLKENISDVKEIVKEEKEGYIDEQSTKTLKEQKIKEEKRRKAKEERQKRKAKSLNSNGGKKND